MNCVINDQIILSRAPEGPISDYICWFAEAAAAQGYAKNSVNRQVLIAACFSRWLGQREVGLQSIHFRSSGAVLTLSRSTPAAWPGRCGCAQAPR